MITLSSSKQDSLPRIKGQLIKIEYDYSTDRNRISRWSECAKIVSKTLTMLNITVNNLLK